MLKSLKHSEYLKLFTNYTMKLKLPNVGKIKGEIIILRSSNYYKYCICKIGNSIYSMEKHMKGRHKIVPNTNTVYTTTWLCNESKVTFYIRSKKCSDQNWQTCEK